MTESTTPAQPEVGYSTTQDAAQALLARWNSKAETPTGDDAESEVQDADEQDAPAAEQADEATADATDESDAQSQVDIELDLAGEKVRLPESLKPQAETIQRKVKELEAGSTRKFQEAAEIRKSAELEREQASIATRFYTENIGDIAEHHRLKQELASYDFNTLRQLAQSSPQDALDKQLEIAGKERRFHELEFTLNQAATKAKERQEQLKQSLMEEGLPQLKKLVPGMSEADMSELSRYIATRNLTALGREALYDAEVVAAFHDAKKYRDLQSAKPSDKKAVQATKTLRPGTAAAPSTGAKQRFEEAKKRAFKSGSTEDLASALQARTMFRK